MSHLREIVERVRASQFGLLRTRRHVSLDGRTLATHAEWKRDEEFVRRFNQLRELGIYESQVYEVADDTYAIPQIDQT